MKIEIRLDEEQFNELVDEMKKHNARIAQIITIKLDQLNKSWNQVMEDREKTNKRKKTKQKTSQD